MLTELRRLVIASAILRQSDATWPKGTKEGGQQKLEVTVGEDSIALQTCRPHPSNTADPDGLNAFFYLVEDVKTFTFSLLELNAGERWKYFEERRDTDPAPADSSEWDLDLPGEQGSARPPDSD